MLVFISDRHDIARNLTKRLHERGVYLFCVPYETALFICDKKDTGGVIIDCFPSQKAGEALCSRLRVLYPEMPIAAIVKSDSVPDMPVDRLIRDAGKDLTEECDSFCRLCGWNDSPLVFADLSVGKAGQEVYYMGYPISLSPMEKEILRCLSYRFPRVTSSDDLLTLCFPYEAVSRSALTVCISNINRKARRLDSRPLIRCQYGKGYLLREHLT